MKKIMFFAILGSLLLQGRETVAATTTVTAPEATPATTPVTEPKKEAKPVELNPEKLMADANSGNCLSCHAIPNKPEFVAGDVGPPFIGMKGRFADIATLRAAIYDQQVMSPQTIMPPFGRNKILTPEQIDVIAQYIYQY
jgi:sulfur-oxidizing protein SoxX